eukprot:scaffold106716_cov17-Tisochrysis_lutea.AAC.1
MVAAAGIGSHKGAPTTSWLGFQPSPIASSIVLGGGQVAEVTSLRQQNGLGKPGVEGYMCAGVQGNKTTALQYRSGLGEAGQKDYRRTSRQGLLGEGIAGLKKTAVDL